MKSAGRILFLFLFFCSAFVSAQTDTSGNAKSKTELQLKEITITDRKTLQGASHNQNGTITLRKENFTSLPALLGENDPIRAVQMQPGVQSGNEGARGVFIRGGSPDQTLLLLDGAPVYNPSHIYGFISVFNADAIDHLDVYKDNYPSRFGGRLCAVLDVSAADGDTGKVQGSFSLGLITSRLHVEGPFSKKKQTTFSVSLRGCYVGLFSGPLSKKQFQSAGSNGSIKYFFGDVNVKLVHRFSAKTKLAFSFFTNSDYYAFDKQSHTDSSDFFEKYSLTQSIYWTNYVSSLRLTHSFNDAWQMMQTLSFSRYHITSTSKEWQTIDFPLLPAKNTFSRLEYTHQSFINDLAWRADVSFTTAKQTFRTGAGIIGRMFETGRLSYDIENDYDGLLIYRLTGTQINTIEAFLYAEDEYRPNKHWVINGGFHANVYHVQQKTFFNILPRLNVVYNPVAKFYLRASASGVSQNLHLLTAASSNILNDHWVPATANSKPENGWNYSAGMSHKLPLHFEWSIDGFYRIMNNVLEYKNGTDQTAVYKPWESQVAVNGKARSYGAEFYVARTNGIVTGSIAYSLSWSERKFDELNHGNYFPYKYDRRHNLAAQINFHIGKHFEIGAAYVYGSGNMFTLPIQSYHSFGIVNSYNIHLSRGDKDPYQDDLLTVFDSRNNARLPSYQHLDLSFTYRKRVKNLEHSFNLSVYNVYNHFNIFAVYAERNVNADGTQTITYKKISLLPVVPSVSYTIKF